MSDKSFSSAKAFNTYVAERGANFSGSLDLRGCTGLTALPDGLTVGGYLYLRGCTGLTALPDGLTVGGSLYLSGCTGLTALPDGLTVGGSLDLRGCTGLTQTPINVPGLGWTAMLIDRKYLQIGCQFHSVAAWRMFSDDELRAISSDAPALAKKVRALLSDAVDAAVKSSVPA